jgi:regulator of protease activity HflC (stomatin/prohibitin superfamily)
MADDDATKCAVGCGGCCSLAVFVTLIVILCNIFDLGPEEQVVVLFKNKREVHNGPKTILLNPFEKTKRRDATRLSWRQYAVVKHERTKKKRHEEGPQLLWLDGYEEVEAVKNKVILQFDQYFRLIDYNGSERILRGPLLLTPDPLECTKQVLDRRRRTSPTSRRRMIVEAQQCTVEKAVVISTSGSSVTVRNSTSGRVSRVSEPGLFVPGPYEYITSVVKDIVQMISDNRAVVLSHGQYVVIRDNHTGKLTNREGPGQIKLEPHQNFYGRVQSAKTVMQRDQYLRLKDSRTGTERVVAGPTSFMPSPTETFVKVNQSILVSDTTTVKVRNIATGLKYTACRCEAHQDDPHRKTDVSGIFSPAAYEEIVEVQKATLLEPSEYAVIRYVVKGIIRHVAGPNLVHLGANDVLADVRKKIVLERDEFVRLVDKKTGIERVVGGPARVMPEPTEVYPPTAGVEKAAFLDVDVAVLLHNKTSGLQQVVTKDIYDGKEPGVFVPKPYEHILGTTNAVRLLSYEAMIVRDQRGQMTIYQGNSSGTHFFIPAYSNIVTQYWSWYGADAKTPGEKLPVQRIDLRERRSIYTFEVRTRDNVRLSASGTIFWRIVDVDAMVFTTEDPEGDIWQRSRSALLQAISQTQLQDFMEGLDDVTAMAFRDMVDPSNTFLEDRGLKLEQLELTSFEVVDVKNAKIIQEIIEEIVNSFKRQATQAKDNHVRQVKLAGDLELEKRRTELLQAQALNKKLRAGVEGKARGLQKVSATSIFIKGLNYTMPSVTDRIELYKMWKGIRARHADTGKIGDAAGTIVMEPGRSNLNINEL